MHNKSRFSLPVDQPFGASASALNVMSVSPAGFVPCPAALLAGFSKEQLEEIARIYDRALEQARKNLNRRFSIVFPLQSSDLDSIGLN